MPSAALNYNVLMDTNGFMLHFQDSEIERLIQDTIFICNAPGSKFDEKIGQPDDFRDSPQSVQANTMQEFNRPRPIPTTTFSTRYLLLTLPFGVIKLEILKFSSDTITRSVRKVSDHIFLCEHLMDYNLARLHEPTLNLSAHA